MCWINLPRTAQQGWQCPVCDRVMAPYVPYCPCEGKTEKDAKIPPDDLDPLDPINPTKPWKKKYHPWDDNHKPFVPYCSDAGPSEIKVDFPDQSVCPDKTITNVSQGIEPPYTKRYIKRPPIPKPATENVFIDEASQRVIPKD